jgi:hypothetical protein
LQHARTDYETKLRDMQFRASESASTSTGNAVASNASTSSKHAVATRSVSGSNLKSSDASSAHVNDDDDDDDDDDNGGGSVAGDVDDAVRSATLRSAARRRPLALASAGGSRSTSRASSMSMPHARRSTHEMLATLKSSFASAWENEQSDALREQVGVCVRVDECHV